MFLLRHVRVFKVNPPSIFVWMLPEGQFGQMVERLFTNQMVLDSSPVAATITDKWNLLETFVKFSARFPLYQVYPSIPEKSYIQI